jgi:hypothetical protein
MSRFQREARVQDHYTVIPHGLWTAPLSYGAKVLLGWLHSHDATYLARLTNNRIREELGASGSVGGWIRELVDAGFLTVEKRGQANQFILKADAWERLSDRKANQPKNGRSHEADKERAEKRSEPADYRPVTSRNTVGNQPKNGHIEEQLEEHVEEQLRKENTHARHIPHDSLELVVEEIVPEDDFSHFWSVYPIKKSKQDTQRAWAKLKRADRLAALDALPDHVEHWRRERTEPKYIPHGSRWLNARRWEDQLPEPQAQTLGLSKAAQTIQEMMKHAVLRESEDRRVPGRSLQRVE